MARVSHVCTVADSFSVLLPSALCNCCREGSQPLAAEVNGCGEVPGSSGNLAGTSTGLKGAAELWAKVRSSISTLLLMQTAK